MDRSEIKRKFIVFAIVIGCTVGFAFTFRLLHVSIWWAMAAVLPGIGILILEHQASHGKQEAGGSLRSLVSLTMVGAVVVWFPMIILVIGNGVLEHAPGRYLNWLAVVVWPVGWAAARFKQYNQKYYGILEVLVGVVTAFGTTLKGQFGSTQGLAVLGAMYVVSRGYGNIADAEKRKEEIERNAQAFRDYRGRVKVASANVWAAILGKPRPRPKANANLTKSEPDAAD